MGYSRAVRSGNMIAVTGCVGINADGTYSENRRRADGPLAGHHPARDRSARRQAGARHPHADVRDRREQMGRSRPRPRQRLQRHPPGDDDRRSGAADRRAMRSSKSKRTRSWPKINGRRSDGKDHGQTGTERRTPSASRSRCKAGSAPAAIPRAASASSSSTTAPASPTSRSSPTRKLPNYERKSSTSRPAAASPSRGEVKASGGKGQATEVHAARGHRPRLGRPRSTTRCRRSGTRSRSSANGPTCGRGPTRSAPSPASATASAARSTTSSRKKASSTSTRRSSPPATAKAPARCSASPRSTRPSRRATTRAKSTTPRTSSASPAYLTVSGQLEGEIYATALGKVYTFGPTFRAENSNTTRHLAEFWMVEPEVAFFELDDNMALAERFLKRICPRRARRLPRGHAVLPRARRRQDRDRPAAKTSSNAISAASATPRRSTS